MIDHIISIGDKSGELGGHLGNILPLNLVPTSHVGIKLFPNKFLISIQKLEE